MTALNRFEVTEQPAASVALDNENSYHLRVDEDHSSDAVLPKSQVKGATERAARISSRALLGGAREMIIEHEGREYRLRVTAQGKLILTA